MSENWKMAAKINDDQPVRKMSENHIAYENAEHEHGLSEVFQPGSIANQVPFRYDGFIKNTVVIFVLGAVGVTMVVEDPTVVA